MENIQAIGSPDWSNRSIWLFLAGKDKGDYHFEEMCNDGVMALCGWDKVGDLSNCKDLGQH